MKPTILRCLALLPFFCCVALADDPPRLDLFTAGAGGYVTYRIPGLVVTKRGTLLAYCEARKGTGDWAPIDLMLRRSIDGGKTWSVARQIGVAPPDSAPNPAAVGRASGQGATMNNPVAITDPISGSVYFFYCVNYARCFLMRSDDDGQSFSEPTEITSTFDKFRDEYDWKVLATGPGHGIRSHNGWLIVPIWLSTGAGAGGHRPSCVATIYSDDNGHSWQRGQIVVKDTPLTPNPSESTAVELPDGRVMLNIRCESSRYRRLISISPDGATNWSKPTFDEKLIDPICEASLLRLPGKDAVLFANPANPPATSATVTPGPAKGKPRQNLTLRWSFDSSKTWPQERVIDAGMAGYCDLAADARGTIYCLYERGGANGNMFQTAALTLVTLEK
jgi:sialidase-1